MLYRQGCDSNIGGHVSARAAGGEDAFWVTGLEYLDQTTPDRVVKLGFDLGLREGEAIFSPAVNFHARIYELRPDVERHRPPPLAPCVRRVVHGPHDRHVQRALGAVPRRPGHLLRRWSSRARRRRRRAGRQAGGADQESRSDRGVAVHGGRHRSKRSRSKRRRATTSSVRRSAAPRSPRPRCSAARRCTASTSCPRCGRRTSSGCAAPIPISSSPWEKRRDRLRRAHPPVRLHRRGPRRGDRAVGRSRVSHRSW